MTRQYPRYRRGMPRAVHHLDLWVVDQAAAADEWGWLLGELDWEVDLPHQSWQHPDGAYLFLDAMSQATGGRALPLGAPIRA